MVRSTGEKMSYNIIFERTLFPIVEIDCRDLLKFSVIDLAHMVNDIKTQLIAREKEIDSAVQEEVGWFLRNVVEEDKIDKWSSMDNSVYPLSDTGAYPPPMTFQVEGAPLTEDQLARECLRHWRMNVKLDKMRLSGKSHEEMKDLGFEAHFLHEALWDQLEQEK